MITPKQLFHYSGTFADQYELAMAEVYFMSGRSQDRAVFDYFFRSPPFSSGFVVFAGLHNLLEVLENLSFTEDDIKFLREQKHHPKFLEYLKSFRFKGDIYSCQEGEVIFPYGPFIRVEGSILETQLIETLLLNMINFESLIATKAARMRHVAGSKTLFEFGLRRAQGSGGHMAAHAAIVGGFDGTSNVKVAQHYGLDPVGTMAHSFIQSEIDELTAFRKFAYYRPLDCVFLLDTFNTLESGLPNAIKVAKEMENEGLKLKGIRLDSGDLAYLSKACRSRLNEANLNYVKIIASNQLDEYVIESLLLQGAPIDIFGVGTKLVTGHPDGALDGVYKLSELNGSPRIKLSESVKKISLPHKKQIFRVYSEENNFLGADAIGLVDEIQPDIIFNPHDHLSSLDISKHRIEALLIPQMKNGKRLVFPPKLAEIKDYNRSRLSLLPDEYKRFTNAHTYKTGLTRKLNFAREQLISQHRSRK
jgi:nicotinate phosphoribosyltransferase